jgi:hypothetical protein
VLIHLLQVYLRKQLLASRLQRSNASTQGVHFDSPICRFVLWQLHNWQ